MNLNNKQLTRYHLVKEMFETPALIRDFDFKQIWQVIPELDAGVPVMLTGEGSSRIFPAQNLIHHNLLSGSNLCMFTEGSLQLTNYPLNGYLVIGASNSGKTSEIVQLFRMLSAAGHSRKYAVTCNQASPLEQLSEGIVVLQNCSEQAVAASKSVVAQALAYDYLLARFLNTEFAKHELADAFQMILSMQVSEDIISALADSKTIYFAGNNNGVAEELVLKTNEILRKKAAFLPGTYLLHGIEEVIEKDDAIILVDPVESEIAKIDDIYREKIGCRVIALTDKKTPFNDLLLPEHRVFHDGYLKLAAGWNMMVEAGIRLKIDIDRPERARKIGNEA